MARLLKQWRGASSESPDPGAEEPSPTCEGCGRLLAGDPLFARYKVCSECGHHHLLSAPERIALLADPGSFRETQGGLYPTDPLGFVDRIPYPQRLDEARRITGLAEAAVTGTCLINGIGVVLAVMDFRFLGGSMGSVVGEKIAAASELAARKRLPLLVVTASGGARMQEGMLALAQMAKTSAAVQRLHSRGVPFLVLLTHPTTGGVYASFGTLGDVLLAEPGALVSFAGPRVAKAMAGQSQTERPRRAEYLAQEGLIDAVVPRPRVKAEIGELLRLASGGRPSAAVRNPLPPASGEVSSAWAAVERARHDNRPTSMDYLHRVASSFVEIHGDRATGDDPAVVCGLADLDGQAVMVVAQERGHQDHEERHGGRARPEGYRKAQRAMRLAAKWRLPVLTLIDTPGADPGPQSEAGGLGDTISHSMALMSSLPTPILSVVIGEGGSGGALALGVADRVLMMENAIFSIIAPEGAAAILYRDPAQASNVANSLKLTSHDLWGLGLVDAVIPEPEGGAHLDHDRAALLLRVAVREHLGALAVEPAGRLLRRRYERWRHTGKTTTAAVAAAGRLVEQLETGIRKGAHTLTGLKGRIPTPFGVGHEEEVPR
ncbi:MAG: carboxyl transferase domain-containing protein [Chloroflexota bacterium]